MKQLCKISDVAVYAVYEEDVFFTVSPGNGKLKIHGLGENDIHFDGYAQILTVIDQEVWAFDQVNIVSVVFEIIDSHLHMRRLDYVAGFWNHHTYTNDYLVGYIRKNDESYFGKINRFKEIVTQYGYNLPDLYKVLDNETIISIRDNFLTCYDLLDGHELWRVDTTEKGSSRSYDEIAGTETIDNFFVHETVVVASLSNAVFLGIDVASGNILWERYLGLAYYTLANANGKMYFLYYGSNYKRYVIVDMLTGKIEADLNGPVDALEGTISFSRAGIYKNFYMITSQQRSQILILNLHTGEALVVIPIEGCRAIGPDAPRACGNRVYQADMANDLYIFEVDFSVLMNKQ